MFTYLFFDDQKLLDRTGFEREYVSPACIGTYIDPEFSTDFPALSVFHTADGKYRMLYHGRRADGVEGTFLAVSEDGINFAPEDTTQVLNLPERAAAHQVLVTKPGDEVANVFEDKLAPEQTRYKLFMTKLNDQERYIDGSIYTSPDLIHWTYAGGEAWNGGSEPVTGIYYNANRGCYTIMRRPFWGDRRVGYTETYDFTHFTPYAPGLQVDSLDAPLDELYGMPVLPYAGMFIGFPVIYTNNAGSREVKYKSGNIYPQLAYSFDGRHFQRSLRQSYLAEYTGQKSMFWLTAFVEQSDGSVLLYTTVAGGEHGPGFWNSTGGKILIYRVRKDGFIAMHAHESGTLATRENIWLGGEMHVNLSAEYATAAVIDEKGQPIQGFDHADCKPFTGDVVDWVPDFGKSMDALINRTIILEIKLNSGLLFSISGNCIPVMNQRASRFRRLGHI